MVAVRGEGLRFVVSSKLQANAIIATINTTKHHELSISGIKLDSFKKIKKILKKITTEKRKCNFPKSGMLLTLSLIILFITCRLFQALFD